MTVSQFPADHHRPRYHFLPPRNWMNDPNGLIQYNGTYHIFYQHNPGGALWGNMHWGHATSKDLVHWTHHPIALSPDPEGPDADGCYSGAMVVHDGKPVVVYTGVRKPHELPCLATSEDGDLDHWTKYPGNPVLPGTPVDVQTTIFRDHTLWREDDSWMMGIGSGIKDQGGAVLLYRSADLVSWDYLHPLAVEQPELNPGGEILSVGWECPDFYFLGDAPVLVACDWDGDAISVSYWTGRYQDQEFHAERRGTVDAGPCFYAPQSFRDESGRRVMMGWLRERRSDDALIEAGWAGAMSLPREVALHADGTVGFSPVQEVVALRGQHQRVEFETGDVALDGIRGDACELLVTTDAAPDATIGLEVLRSPDGEERTIIMWDPLGQEVVLDTTRSSKDPRVTGDYAVTRVPVALHGGLELRVFVDRSVIEVYANDRVCVSGRGYPTWDGHFGVRMMNSSGVAGHLDIWEMADVMP